MEATINVLGGLTITVEFSIDPADPSVGIMSADIGDWSITHIAGRKCHAPKWLYKRIENKDGEIGRIEVALWERYQELKRETFNEPDYE